ncbi:MAG: hypothetical protein QOJ41_2793 [Acidobacteriaceae bacterium]|jgi:uncharacterized damage-inducible protein DinB|nr:hypothetical protein [Acidobacteriaceae bacterium]
MEALQPQQAAVFFKTFSLPALNNEHRITKQIIEAIPLDKGEYKPDAVSKTALELAWHIVAAEHRFLDGIVAGEFDFTPNHRPDSMRDSAGIAAWYAKTFEADLARLTKLKEEQLVKVIDFRGMFQLPAIAYVQFNLHHSIHHRGQLSMYLRPMGAKVPAIYGESYDSAEARKAASSS